MDDIKETLDNKLTCVLLFIDHTKAFDTVDHPLLIFILFSASIGFNASKLFLNYPTNLSQTVKHGHVLSDPITDTKGVQQGSVWDLCFVDYLSVMQ